MSVVIDTQLLTKFSHWLRYDCDFKPRTIETAEKQIKYLTAFLNGSSLTIESCKSFIVYLKQNNKAPATISMALTTMRLFCRFLASLDPTHEDFTDKLPVIKRKETVVDVLNTDEINRLITCVREYRYKGLQDFWDTLLSLLARTGRRVTEIASLQVRDLDMSRCAILLRDPKNSIPQWIPIPQDVASQVEKLCRKKTPTDYIFKHDMTAGHVSTVAIRKELQHRARLVGITKRVHPHLLRHSFPVEILRMNVPLPQVQRLMGHRQLNSTMRYIHLVLDDLRSAANSHPLNQAELTALQIISSIEKDLKKYTLEERLDLQFEVNHSSKEFSFKIRWN